jgi:hypothetical protein
MKQGQSWLLAAAGVVAATPALPSELAIKVTLPQIAATGPRPPLRPYVAIWLRKDDNSWATDLAVWYQIEGRRGRGAGPGAPAAGGPPGGPGAGAPPPGAPPAGAARPGGPGMQRPPENPKTPGGARWLNEVRQWWADSGNRLQFPVDGLTSASRAVGTHELTFAGTDPKLASLPPGNYKLMVEASREHGGIEAVSIPFTWPAKSVQTAQTSGKTELGAVELTVKP